MRRWKQRSPLRYEFWQRRNNAQHRNIPWTITFNEFIDLISLRSDVSLSLDRIDASKGYMLSNVQWLTLRDNSIKGNKEKEQK